MQPAHLVLTPETRLVLATAAGAASPVLQHAWSPDLRWDGVLKVAVHERAVSGAWAALRQHAGQAMPDEAVRAFERLTLGTRLRMTWLAHRLDETVKAFDAAGVPVVLLKGAAVGSTVYRSIAERQMGDLDLLVPPDKAAAARQAALQVGWGTTEREREEAFYAGHHHLPPLRDHRTPDLQLEIHTGLFPEGHPYALVASDVWRDARFHPATGAYVPSPVDQVLHICIHFGWAHMMSQGAWQAFRDLGQISSQRGFDWGAVVEGARRIGAVGVSYWTLALARAAGGVAVPADVLAALGPRRNGAVLAALGRHLGLLMDPLATPCPSYALSHRLWLSALRDDIGNKPVTTPWARDELNFVVRRHPDPSSRHWLARHLFGMGDYLRYARTLTRGGSRAAATQAQQQRQ